MEQRRSVPASVRVLTFESDGPCKQSLWAADARGRSARLSFGAVSSIRNVDMGSRRDRPDAFRPKIRTTPARPFLLFSACAPVLPATAEDAFSGGKPGSRVVGQEHVRSVPPMSGRPNGRSCTWSSSAEASSAGHPVVTLCTRDRKANGTFGRIVPLHLQLTRIHSLPLAEDREILSALAGGTQYYGYTELRWFPPTTARSRHPSMVRAPAVTHRRPACGPHRTLLPANPGRSRRTGAALLG